MVRQLGTIPILIELMGSENEAMKEGGLRGCARLSYDEADRMALAEAGPISILIDMMLHDESEAVKDYAAEALVNFAEDPLYHDRISDAFSVPSFRDMQIRVVHIRASREHMARWTRIPWLLTWNPDLV